MTKEARTPEAWIEEIPTIEEDPRSLQRTGYLILKYGDRGMLPLGISCIERGCRMEITEAQKAPGNDERQAGAYFSMQILGRLYQLKSILPAGSLVLHNSSGLPEVIEDEQLWNQLGEKMQSFQREG